MTNLKELPKQGQTKVEGWVDPSGFTEQGIMVVLDEQQPGDVPCTVVFAPPGSTVPPEVMTKEEVRMMLRELKDASEKCELWPAYMQSFAAKHGIHNL